MMSWFSYRPAIFLVLSRSFDANLSPRLASRQLAFSEGIDSTTSQVQGPLNNRVSYRNRHSTDERRVAYCLAVYGCCGSLA